MYYRTFGVICLSLLTSCTIASSPPFGDDRSYFSNNPQLRQSQPVVQEMRSWDLRQVLKKSIRPPLLSIPRKHQIPRAPLYVLRKQRLELNSRKKDKIIQVKDSINSLVLRSNHPIGITHLYKLSISGVPVTKESLNRFMEAISGSRVDENTFAPKKWEKSFFYASTTQQALYFLPDTFHSYTNSISITTNSGESFIDLAKRIFGKQANGIYVRGVFSKRSSDHVYCDCIDEKEPGKTMSCIAKKMKL